MKTKIPQLIAISCIILSSNLFAGELTIPNTFTSGTKALASEVNANFSAVEAEVDDNANEISNNSLNINTLTTNSATNSDNITTNSNNISSNTSNISINAANLSSHEADISAHTPSGINVNYNPSFISLASADTTVVQLDITAPADGYVLVQYSGVVSISHTNGTRDMVRVELFDSISNIANGPSFNVVQVPASSPTGTSIYYSSMKTQRLFPVTKDNAYSFYLRADLFAGTSASIGYNYISGIFLPTTVGTLPINY